MKLKYVDNQKLTVRNGPSLSATRIGSIYKNQIIEPLGSAEGDGLTWYKILWNGDESWVADVGSFQVVSDTNAERNDATVSSITDAIMNANIQQTYHQSNTLTFPQTPEWRFLEEIKNYRLINVPIGDSRRITQMNRYRIQEPNGSIGTRSFVFMTRPDLSIRTYGEGGVVLKDDFKKHPFFTYVAGLPYYGDLILGSLQGGLASNYNSHFLPIITNTVKGYSPTDAELETAERGETFHGHKVIYGKHNFKHRTANSITLPFQDTRDLLLYLTVKVWMEYINGVSIGWFSPNREYIHEPQLDYAVSLYYIATKEDMEEIVYWEKLVGVFPTSSPDSLFDYREGDYGKALEYNVTFAYSSRRVLDPVSLGELNYIYTIGGKRYSEADFKPNYNPTLDTHGVPYVTGPYITVKDNKYMLRWV